VGVISINILLQLEYLNSGTASPIIRDVTKFKFNYVCFMVLWVGIRSISLKKALHQKPFLTRWTWPLLHFYSSTFTIMYHQ